MLTEGVRQLKLQERSLHNRAGSKEKTKKELGHDLNSGERAVKQERFPQPGNPPHWWEISHDGKGASGEKGQQAACGRQDRDGWVQKACVTYVLCNSSFGGQTLGEDGMAAWKQPEAAGVWHRLQPGVYPDRAWTCVRSATLNRHVKGGPTTAAPLLARSRQAQLRLYELSEDASVGCPPVYVGPTLEPSPHSCAICGLTLPPLPHRSCKLSICGTPKWVTGAPMAGARLASAAAGFVGTPT